LARSGAWVSCALPVCSRARPSSGSQLSCRAAATDQDDTVVTVVFWVPLWFWLPAASRILACSVLLAPTASGGASKSAAPFLSGAEAAGVAPPLTYRSTW